jgi:hypothetical protein
MESEMNAMNAAATGAADGRVSAAVRRSVARSRPIAWIGMVATDVGLLAWAAMAAVAPERLIGPSSMPILPAGFQGFTGASWQDLVATAPRTAEYATLLFRMFGLYGTAFSLLAIAVGATAFRRGERWAWWGLLVGNALTYVGAMAYDQVVRAVGPFELTEYLGLAVVIAALAVTVPSTFRRRPQSTEAPTVAS